MLSLLRRSTPRGRVAGLRFLTTYDDDEDGKKRGSRGRREQRSSPPDVHSKHRHPLPPSSSRSSKQRNFDERLLRPAQRGELVGKHSSEIPKLAARKAKARLVPGSAKKGRSSFSMLEEERDSLLEDDDFADEALAPRLFESVVFEKQLPVTQPGEDDIDKALQLLEPSLTSNNYYDFKKLLDDEDKYYWREEEYEELDVEDVELDEDGTFEFDFSEEDVNMLVEEMERKSGARGGGGEYDDEEEDDEKDFGFGFGNDDEDGPRGGRGGAVPGSDEVDPEAHFFFDQNDLMQIAQLPDEYIEKLEKNKVRLDESVLPLRPHGQNLDDFLEAVHEHPSKFASVTFERPHPDRLREPKAIFSTGRLQPSLEFVESYARFLYVSNLPPLDLNGEAGDLNNPVHRNMIQKTVAKLMDVDSERVFVASISSAYVGYDSPKAFAEALDKGPTEPVLTSLPMISLLETGSDLEFCKKLPESIVHISNFPPGQTPTTLMQALFPPGTEVADVYGNVTAKDFYFLSASDVLIRFSSPEQAQSSVSSMLVQERLQELGQYRIRLFRARRELLHAGFDDKKREKRKMGPRLIVDGDMPSRSFFLSHARVIQLRNVDPSLSKSDISKVFDAYSARFRDVEGSVEFATCEAGEPTGVVYVGFDAPGEAEAAVRGLNGSLLLGDRRTTLRLVKDRVVPGIPLRRPDKRPERKVDMLLDDLNNWEKYVSPEDLKTLEKAGISKVVLDEALRGIRYNNPTFGALDSSVRSEALEPEKAPGEQYKELVQLYVSTLIECLPTKDNVGEIYQSIHFPGEDVDLSIFDRETERQKELLSRRAG